MPFDARAYFVRFANAVNTRDFDELNRLVHPDFTAEIHQSGERSRGFKDFLAQLENYPEGAPSVPADADIVGGQDRWAISPGYTVVPLSAANEFTIVTNAVYPDGTRWHIVMLIELRDERLYRMENYFAPEMPAPLAEAIRTYLHGRP